MWGSTTGRRLTTSAIASFSLDDDIRNFNRVIGTAGIVNGVFGVGAAPFHILPYRATTGTSSARPSSGYAVSAAVAGTGGGDSALLNCWISSTGRTLYAQTSRGIARIYDLVGIKDPGTVVPRAPGNPTSFVVTARTSTTITLRISAPSNWGTGSDREYNRHRATNAGFTANLFGFGGLAASGSSDVWTNSNLTPNATYWYRVRAETTAGRSGWVFASATTRS